MKNIKVILPETIYKYLPGFCIGFGIGSLITFAHHGIGLFLAVLLVLYGISIWSLRQWKY